MQKNISLKALVLTALAPVIWSTGGLGIRLLDISPWTILFWRALFMTLTLTGWSIYRMRGSFFTSFRENILHGLPVSIFLGLSLILYVLSMTQTTVADSLLIQGTGPIFIVVIGWIVLREPVRGITITALVLVAAGILIIMIPSLERGGLSGNLFGLAKALAFAAGTIAIRRKKSVGMLPAMALAGFFSLIVALPLVPDFSIDLRSLIVLAYLGIFQIGVGFTLFVNWSGKLTSSQTGLLVILEAVLGPLWPWIFLGEAPYRTTFIGGALILTALVAHSLLYSRGRNA